MTTESIHNPCNFMKAPMEGASILKPFLFRMAKKIPNKLLSARGYLTRLFFQTLIPLPKNQTTEKEMDLQVGNWVQVRSMREIASTLDNQGKCDGLYFMPEMEDFCGKKFQIFKIAEKIKLESNGELRKLRQPSYFLEGVFCTGQYQGGCDRSCFHYWRRSWLVPLPNPEEPS